MKARTLVKTVAGWFGMEVKRQASVRAPRLIDIHAPGVDFTFWIANDTGSLWYEHAGHVHNAELLALRSMVRVGDRVLEVGCHHGLLSVYLGKLAGPSGTVVAVEAEPGNALIAQAQLQLNHLGHCRIEAAAAGATAGKARISLVDNVISGAGLPDELIEVPMVMADDLDALHGPFTIIKIDVEGYEAKVLRGASAILKRRPRLALELHGGLLQQAGDHMDDIHAILTEVGYQGTVLLPNGEQRPYEAARLANLGREHVKINLFLYPV